MKNIFTSQIYLILKKKSFILLMMSIITIFSCSLFFQIADYNETKESEIKRFSIALQDFDGLIRTISNQVKELSNSDEDLILKNDLLFRQNYYISLKQATESIMNDYENDNDVTYNHSKLKLALTLKKGLENNQNTFIHYYRLLDANDFENEIMIRESMEANGYFDYEFNKYQVTLVNSIYYLFSQIGIYLISISLFIFVMFSVFDPFDTDVYKFIFTTKYSRFKILTTRFLSSLVIGLLVFLIIFMVFYGLVGLFSWTGYQVMEVIENIKYTRIDLIIKQIFIFILSHTSICCIGLANMIYINSFSQNIMIISFLEAVFAFSKIEVINQLVAYFPFFWISFRENYVVSSMYVHEIITCVIISLFCFYLVYYKFSRKDLEGDVSF